MTVRERIGRALAGLPGNPQHSLRPVEVDETFGPPHEPSRILMGRAR